MIKSLTEHLDDEWHPLISGRKLSVRTQKVWDKVFSNHGLPTIPFSNVQIYVNIQSHQEYLSCQMIKKKEKKSDKFQGHETFQYNKICEKCEKGPIIFEKCSLICTNCGDERYYQKDYPDTLYCGNYDFYKPKRLSASEQVNYRFYKFLYSSYAQDLYFLQKHKKDELSILKKKSYEISNPFELWKILRKEKKYFWCEHYVALWYYLNNIKPIIINNQFLEEVIKQYRIFQEKFLSLRKNTKRYNCIHKPFICLYLCQHVRTINEKYKSIPDPIVKLPKILKTNSKIKYLIDQIINKNNL